MERLREARKQKVGKYFTSLKKCLKRKGLKAKPARGSHSAAPLTPASTFLYIRILFDLSPLLRNIVQLQPVTLHSHIADLILFQFTLSNFSARLVFLASRKRKEKSLEWLVTG